MRLPEPSGEFSASLQLDIECRAAWFQPSPSEPVAAYERGHIEKIAPDSPAIGGRWQVADVPRKRAEVAGVIGETFEFEGNPAQNKRSFRNPAARKRFDRLAIREGMAGSRIAGKGFHVMHSAFGGSAD